MPSTATSTRRARRTCAGSAISGSLVLPLPIQNVNPRGLTPFTASKTWRRDYQPREIGTVTLNEGERFQIEMKPVAKEWKPVYVHQVELVPVE